MKVTNQQKILGGILLLGAIALSADRLLFLKASNSPVAQPANEYAVAPVAKPAGKTESASISVAERLRNTACGLADNEQKDAFAFGVSWVPAPAKDAVPESGTSAEQFRQSHRLTGVLTSNGHVHAMVDGRIIAVGQVVDGYRLVSVSYRAATFDSGRAQAVLSMAERSGVTAVTAVAGTAP